MTWTVLFNPVSETPTRNAAWRSSSSEFGSTSLTSTGVFHGLVEANGLKADAVAGTVCVLSVPSKSPW